jgi:hypothetical protein
MTEKKPEQTPREKITKLAEMSPEEFSRFMRWNFRRICSEPLPPTVSLQEDGKP